MQDLIDKIEELRKALGMKSAKSSLVPALKPPTIKPISISKPGVPAPIKMPGITPQSNKDPKKVAEQLKDPKQKKPKIEIMKTDKNGQWSLHKEDHYRVHVEGQPVTQAMPLKNLVAAHGPVKHIESNPANKVVPVKKP